MQDRFRAKTWFLWAKFIALGGLGCFSLVFGVLFWTGAMTSASGRSQPAAGPPMVIIGVCLVVVAILAAVSIAGRARPLIRCFREGIELNIVGATSLDEVPLVPGTVRLAWAILSLQGFRSTSMRIAWPDFRKAEVSGIRMAYVLRVQGTAVDVRSGAAWSSIGFQQVALADDPHSVAEALNHLGASPEERERLPSWGDAA